MTDLLHIPQMATIKETAEIFKLPVHFVRKKVSDGEIVAVRAGKRFLVNVDKFAEYLNNSTIAPTKEKTESGKIYPIELE